MAGNLPIEFSKFGKHRRYLKKILNNTKSALADIYRSGYFTQEQLSELNLRIEDEEKIVDIIENPIGLIVLGSKSWAKANIVNELLGYALLPINDNQVNCDDVNSGHSSQSQSNNVQESSSQSNSSNSDNWRTIRMMYGTQTQVSLAVANHYELVEHLAVYDRVWHQIPASDLEVKDVELSADPGYTSATLEIKLPHHLLADDVQIIVAPSSGANCSFESIYHTCFDGVSPIVIYALTDCDSLNSNEVDDLMELQRLAPKIPVFFIRSQRTSSGGPSNPSANCANPRSSSRMDRSLDAQQLSAASELTESQQHLLLTRTSPQFINTPPMSPPPSHCASPTLMSRSPSNMSSSVLNESSKQQQFTNSLTLFQQLCSLGFLSPSKSASNIQELVSPNFATRTRTSRKRSKDGVINSELVENFDNFPSILLFVRNVLQSHLVLAANTLHALHMRCLRVFILTAFDMTRDMMITPKRLEYARLKEQQLFDSLMSIANKKQEEIKHLISDTLNGMRPDLLEEVARYEFKTSTLLTARLCSSEECPKVSDLSRPLANHDLQSSEGSSAASTSSAPGMIRTKSRPSSPSTSRVHDHQAGTMSNSSSRSQPKFSARDYQIALTEIQDFVLNHLNTAIAGKLIGSVDYLRDSYVGTLERCLSSLEKATHDPGESVAATNALKQILNAAYQVEINMKATSSLVRALWEKMKQFVASSLLWRAQPVIDRDWKVKVAADILDSLSEWRLAKSICAQFKERLRMSHEQFASAMKQLESVHSGRLERTEEHRVRVRKVYAPKIARYALESTSLRDLIVHGMPQLGREIGRGQYGVVYACDSWAGHSPVALKSVVPPDDKHWNDLAMEFYYTKSIPDHDRIVQIRGSVIDHSYGGGSTPAVLLIMDRLTRDLYSAIRNGLDWVSRLQVAIDVVQGIRFLHSQGLVHRDIKLKNVLMDKKNRAKITDLGFCKPEAMMSGSIVGTPIHMAPELFSGKYDNSVDVYAFGILFWYICAGHVRLPYVFEQCQNKDQLWNCVRRGSRPEKLPQFDEECWTIMEQCWAGEPQLRPLLGDVEPRLVAILERYKNSRPPTGYTRNYMRSRTSTNQLPSSYGHHTPHHHHRHQSPAGQR